MKNGILRGPDNRDGLDGWNSFALASDDPIFVDNHLRTIKFMVENRSAGNHSSKLTRFTLPGATVKIFIDGRELFPVRVHERFLVVELPVSSLTHNIKITCDLPD